MADEKKDSDAQFIAGVGTALNAGDMMGAWCAATVHANAAAAKATAEFLKEVAFDESGNVRMVKASMDVGTLHYEEESALINYIKTPSMEVKESTFGLDMEITTSRATNTHLEGSMGGSADVQVGWGFVSAKMHVEAKFSASSDRTHKQDSSAKVHAQITMGPCETPPGIIRLQERLQKISDAYTDKMLKDDAQRADGQTNNKPANN